MPKNILARNLELLIGLLLAIHSYANMINTSNSVKEVTNDIYEWLLYFIMDDLSLPEINLKSPGFKTLLHDKINALSEWELHKALQQIYCYETGADFNEEVMKYE
jgi:hypothetical protein